MLVSLSIRDFVLIEKLDLNFSRSSGEQGRGRTGRAHRRDRCRQVDPDRCARPCPGRPRRIGRGAAGRQPGIGGGLVRPAEEPSGPRRAGRAGARRRGRPDPAPPGRRRRPRPRLRQRSAGVGGAAAPAGRYAGRDPGTDGAARPFGHGDPSRLARCLRRAGETGRRGAGRLARLAHRRAGARRRRSGGRRRAARRGFPAPCGEGTRDAGAQAG